MKDSLKEFQEISPNEKKYEEIPGGITNGVSGGNPGEMSRDIIKGIPGKSMNKSEEESLKVFWKNSSKNLEGVPLRIPRSIPRGVPRITL